MFYSDSDFAKGASYSLNSDGDFVVVEYNDRGETRRVLDRHAAIVEPFPAENYPAGD